VLSYGRGGIRTQSLMYALLTTSVVSVGVPSEQVDLVGYPVIDAPVNGRGLTVDRR